MKPVSFSASALQVASLCLGRYVAENHHRGERLQNDAAGLGTVVHGALQTYVDYCYIKESHEKSLQLLYDLFEIQYLGQFGNLDKSTDWYKDGRKMLKAWYERGDLEQPGRKVISVEQKTSFPVRMKGYPEVPFNYIWDRFDQVDEHEFVVVDYKTNRYALNHDELRNKPQARAYGLAAQIQVPEAKEIWVEFDFLRHEGPPVGTLFTREDNIETWNRFKAEFKRIWDTDENNPPYTLNTECHYCVMRQTCPAVQSNIRVGGFMNLAVDDMVDLRGKLEGQLIALKANTEEIDAVLLHKMQNDDLLELDGHTKKAEAAISKRRSVDSHRVRKVVGDEIWAKYGADSISMENFDNLRKDPALTKDQLVELGALVGRTYGNPRIKIKDKTNLTGP